MDFTSHFTSETSFSSIPRLLWEYYLEYLWFYEDGSWVARAASSFRVLAFVLIVPMIIISLLDITSYLIARTLGIVDDVKASTSDKKTIHSKEGMPSIVLQDTTSTSAESTPPSESFSSATPDNHTHRRHPSHSQTITERHQYSRPQTYFASEDMQLRISGEGVFSPDISQPPSPKLTRHHLRSEANSD